MQRTSEPRSRPGRRAATGLWRGHRKRPFLNAVKIDHQGEEAYMNMWQKLRSIWSYVHEHYSSDYDFFSLGEKISMYCRRI